MRQGIAGDDDEVRRGEGSRGLNSGVRRRKVRELRDGSWGAVSTQGRRRGSISGQQPVKPGAWCWVVSTGNAQVEHGRKRAICSLVGPQTEGYLGPVATLENTHLAELAA